LPLFPQKQGVLHILFFLETTCVPPFPGAAIALPLGFLFAVFFLSAREEILFSLFPNLLSLEEGKKGSSPKERRRILSGSFPSPEGGRHSV